MRDAMDKSLQRLGRVKELEGEEAPPGPVTDAKGSNTYVVQSTGARVFLHTAVQMLNNLCATMHDDRYGAPLSQSHCHRLSAIAPA